ncbi:Immunity protein Imm1 [Lentzea waywayandensis]|uniref:Immunity protein Imm1 n=1 Tax=Lentzea waywayandensis TaxID=84724 RepID=A0A1I6F651_9PSEU|nr:Imm1 family immunity protein [Lentzea waywayandensis]SFR25416.1 Immunity protein Imm1 [Lentzea waywayandensis]
MTNSLSVWYFRDVDDDDEPVAVDTDAALDALLDDVLANHQPHPTVVVADGRPTVGALGLPDHQLKFATDRESGTAALYLMDAQAHRAWTTKSEPATATLWLDRDADIAFPSDSVVSLAQLREALHEFMRTSERPTCVQWQEFDVF